MAPAQVPQIGRPSCAQAPDRLAQLVDVEQPRDRRALAAGDDQRVDAGEMRRQPHLDRLDAESSEHGDVLGEVALQRQHANGWGTHEVMVAEPDGRPSADGPVLQGAASSRAKTLKQSAQRCANLDA